MELIIAAALFTILVACWIVLPADAGSAHAHSSVEAMPSTSAK